MKKILNSVLAGIVVLSMLFSSVHAGDNYNSIFTDSQPLQTKEYKQKFWDVDKSHWAYNSIAELSDRGAINGYSDGSFKPEKTVTRAEWSKIMIQAAGLSANDYSVRFTDMNGHWAAPYVNAASNYLTAFNDGSYRPNQAATREDVTVAMVKLKGYNLDEVDYSVLSKFKDVSSISNSIKVYVAIAVEKGLITGFEDGTFRGQATLTRAQAATLLWRAFQFGNDNKSTASSSATSDDNSGSNVYQPDNNVVGENAASSQNNNVLTVNDLNGSYSDVLSKRAHMDIKKKNDIYKINIGWGSSAWETTEWYFDAKLDKSTGNLVYQDGYEFNIISKDDGTVAYDLINDKCEGNFVFSGNLLIWNDYSEDTSEKCKFEKRTNTDEKDYSSQYDGATRELQKYINSCMKTNTYENVAAKEERISDQYNLARGMLLSCFGYKDSDESLEKLNSVHNIAIKLPESIETVSRKVSLTNCSASMRDTKLFAENKKFVGDSALSLKFAYDYSEFDAKITDLFGRSDMYECVRFIVSLFADNYRDAEFARLLKEAYYAAGDGDSVEFNMYYGGYNLEITVESAGYNYENIYINGQKGAKKQNNTVSNSSNKNTSTDKSDTVTQKPAKSETPKKESTIETPKAETPETYDYDYEKICNYCGHSDGIVTLKLKNGVKVPVEWKCSSCGKENQNSVKMTW